MEAEITKVFGGHFKHTPIKQLPILIDILKKKSYKNHEMKCQQRAHTRIFRKETNVVIHSTNMYDRTQKTSTMTPTSTVIAPRMALW